MVKLTPASTNSLFDILRKIEVFQNDRDISWYRGVGSSLHSLIPSLCRRAPTLLPDELSKIERSISNTFAQRSPPFIQLGFETEWKRLFYMQHYGIPTRLLDWSESPFVGLYFALTSVKRDSNGVPLDDAAFWMCDPVVWNRKALAHISFSGGVLDENAEEMKAYSPGEDVEQRATLPIMIYGNHNSPRIVAQRGVFALFGKGTVGMEIVFDKENFPKDCLKKIIIPRQSIDSVLKSLHRKGIAESTIFPDLYGLSMEIKRLYGYF